MKYCPFCWILVSEIIVCTNWFKSCFNSALHRSTGAPSGKINDCGGISWK